MGKGKKMAGGSFMSKHAKNLLNYMPIDDKASALQYKDKDTPLHSNHNDDHKPGSGYWSKGSVGDKYLGPMLGGTADYSGGLRSKSQGGRSLVAPSSKGGRLGFAGDSTPKSKIKKKVKK